MPSRYRHHKPTPEEFVALMKAGNVKLNDFLFLTGRHAVQVKAFMEAKDTGSATNLPYSPTMGDVLILEIAKRYGMVQAMLDIAADYVMSIEEEEARKRDRPAI